ncbi:MAG: hypothetical protein OEZ39_02840 [Gammaproteobacteria bacterium]|nr:hypothetical protein [Gammaproteobacteria bacterium]MDH5650792.1 hypothetical protein [Gammaproteobacteria bacterium]
MKSVYGVVLVALLSPLTACDQKQKSTDHLLLFTEADAEVEPGTVRVIVSADYMRMDSGENAEGYILLDRKQKVIYSVDRTNRQIITISDSGKELKPTVDLKLSEIKVDSTQDMPAIGGKKPQHYQYKSGDELCYESMSIKGLLPGYVQAMQEYNLILARDSVGALTSLPADLRNGCDMARHTFAPNRHLQHGTPVVLWHKGVFVNTLVDYKENYKADKLLFELPKDYQTTSITELRSGAAGKFIQ